MKHIIQCTLIIDDERLYTEPYSSMTQSVAKKMIDKAENQAIILRFYRSNSVGYTETGFSSSGTFFIGIEKNNNNINSNKLYTEQEVKDIATAALYAKGAWYEDEIQDWLSTHIK